MALVHKDKRLHAGADGPEIDTSAIDPNRPFANVSTGTLIDWLKLQHSEGQLFDHRIVFEVAARASLAEHPRDPDSF